MYKITYEGIALFSENKEELISIALDKYEDGYSHPVVYSPEGKCIFDAEKYSNSDERYYEMTGNPWDA